MDKVVERLFFTDKAIDEKDINTVQLLRTGKLNHPLNREITKKHLKEAKKNFNNNSLGVKINLDFGHNHFEEAAAWIENIELRNNDNELWVDLEWTPKAREKILNKEYRYTSAEIVLDYLNPTTNKKQGATLLGGGVTNRPFVTDMAAMLSESNNTKLLTNKKDKTMGLQEILKDVDSLKASEKLELSAKLGNADNKDKDSIALQLSESLVENQKINIKLTDIEDKNLKLSQAKIKVDDELSLIKKESAFTLLLSKAKACPAQKEAFMKGDMTAFAEKAQAVNLSAQGTEGGAGDGNLDSNKATLLLSQKITELASKGISYVEASKMVTKENPKLLAQAQQ